MDLIGNTPMVRIKNLGKVELFAKLEGFNPGGSIKDRIALAMLEKAEKNGSLTVNKTIIEASSGNTGIALAMLGAAKGYQVEIVMPENASAERIAILRAYGANVVLTSKEHGVDGAIAEAKKRVESEPNRYFLPDQYSNDANPLAHYQKTAKEIYRQIDGKLDYFVATIGTGGTVTGTGKALKELIPSLKVIAIQPMPVHKIQGLKNLSVSLVPKVYSGDKLDETIYVSDEDAFRSSRELAKQHGLLVGMSSGAAYYGALRIAERIGSGRIATILPDRGERYLSTDLYKGGESTV
jgi:cysteine synthase B